MKYLHLTLWILLASLLINCGGGSPLRDIATLDPDDESGIGGTGILAQESGMGGTGIIGEVTGFGSIFVNGVEVELDQDTPLYLNGLAVKQYNLAIGDVVEILTRKQQGMSVADEIHIRHEVIGSVEKINRQTRTITVLGQKVLLIKQKQSLPEIGQTVRVSGFRDHNGLIHSRRVVETAETQSLLIGTLKKKGSAYYIGQQKIKFTDNAKVKEGVLLRVSGTLQDSTLKATKYVTLDRLPFTQPVDHLLVQGFISKQNGQQYKVGDIVFGVPSLQLQKQLHTQAGQVSRVVIRRKQFHWQAQHIILQKDLPVGLPRLAPERGNFRPVVPPYKPLQRNQIPQRFMR